MAPFYRWGTTSSKLQSHYEKAVYFLALSSQKFSDVRAAISEDRTNSVTTSALDKTNINIHFKLMCLSEGNLHSISGVTTNRATTIFP